MNKESWIRIRKLLKIEKSKEWEVNDYRERWTDAEVLDIYKSLKNRKK